jgi:hypothetical protein
MLLLGEALLRLRRLRGPLFGFGHARIWLLLIVLVLILVVSFVNNRNNRNRR